MSSPDERGPWRLGNHTDPVRHTNERRAGFDATVNGNYCTAYGFVDQDGEAGDGRRNQGINSDF